MAVDAPPVSPEGADPLRNAILDIANTVRQARVSWDSYLQAKLVSEETLGMLRQYDEGEDSRTRLLQSQGSEFVGGLIHTFSKLSNVETLRHVVTLLDDIITEDSGRIEWVVQAAASLSATDEPVASWQPFLKRLERSDDSYLSHQCARILTRLVLAGETMDERAAGAFLSWVSTELRAADKPGKLLALTALASCLRKDFMRFALITHSTCLDAMRTLLKPDGPMQMLYQVTLCLWILTFNATAVANMADVSQALLSAVSSVLQVATKEKLVRVCIAFTRNLLAKAPNSTSRNEFAALLIQAQVLPMVTAIVHQNQYADEELVEDAEYVEEHLKAMMESLSSYDEYSAELKSGTLRWTPVHRSERFWCENVTKFNDNKHAALKLLVAYLSKEDDPQSLAIAIHDCGEYVRHYPYGKRALDELNAKALIMAHMEHTDSTVRYESLIAVQKLMTDHWEFLGQQTKKAAEGSA